VRRRDRALRAGLGTFLLVGSLGFVIPLGLGLWDPAWLRLAGDVQLDPSEPTLEPGEVRHPFVVEQSDLNGRLRWRLSGAGLRGPSDAADLLKDQVVLEPRLELFSLDGKPGQEVTRISAERARIQVSEGEGGARRVRLDLGPALRLQRGGLRLSGEALVAWFDPDHPSDLRLKTQEALVVEYAEEGAEGARWKLEATSLQASAERIVLGGPVQVRGGPFRGGPLDGYGIEGVARTAVLEPRGARAPAGAEFTGPWNLALQGLKVEGAASVGTGSFELVAERAGIRLKPAPSSGVKPEGPQRPTPEAFSFEGGVVGRLRRDQPALDLSLRGDRLQLEASAGIVLEGRNAELSEAVAGFRARGERFEIQEAEEGLTLTARALEELEFREVERAPAKTGQAPPTGTWRGQAGSLRVDLAGVAGLTTSSVAQLWSGSRPLQGEKPAGGGVAQVTTAARALSLLERVRSLEIGGGLELERRPGPDRLRLESLRWAQTGEAVGGEAPLRTLEVEGLEALVSQARSDAAEGRPKPGVPWLLESGNLRLTTRRSLASLAELISASAPAASASPARAPELPWSRPLAALESLEARGGFKLVRDGRESDPRRKLRKARGLSATQLSYGGERRELVAGGRVVATLGAMKISGPKLTLDPESGRVFGPEVRLDLVRLVKTKTKGLVREEYQARADQAEATLSLDPGAWSEERARRSGRRRAGAALTVPEPLQALDLRGGVTASGPRALKAEAKRVRLAGRRLRLEGSPALLSEERGQISARHLRLSWEEADLAPLASGVQVARDATRALVDAEGGVLARGSLGARSFTLAAERARGEIYEVVGLPAKDPQAPFPLGAFSASGAEGVTLGWVAQERGGGSRDLKLRTNRLRGHGRAELPGGGQALRLELLGRWATTLSLPKRGLSQVSGGRARALLDPSALRAGARPEEKEEAYLRRLLRGLTVTEGLRLSASGFEARAKEARLDPERSAYLLSGDPVVLRRGGLRQTMRQATIRLSDE